MPYCNFDYIPVPNNKREKATTPKKFRDFYFNPTWLLCTSKFTKKIFESTIIENIPWKLAGSIVARMSCAGVEAFHFYS